jgi:nucleolar protein 56
MKAYVATNLAGVFAFDGKGKVISKKLFPKDAAAIADRLERSRSGILIEEEREVLSTLAKKGVSEAVMDKDAHFEGIDISCEPENMGRKIALNEFRRLAIESGWASGQAELNNVMTRVNVVLAGRKITNVGRDKVIMQVVGVVEELDATLNSLYERLREWYGLHFPELSREIKSHETFAGLVEKYGARESMTEMETLASKSVGMDFSEEDAKSVREFSGSILEMAKAKEKISKYLESLCREIMPNLSAIAGPLLAARLVAQAGGLEKIAKLPSSTVQLLGAEKALFRHLRNQGRAPKYGIIYSHPLIQQAPKHLKGKVARLIASKLSLAAKMDFYSKRDQSKAMKEDLERKVAGLVKNSSTAEEEK